MNTLTSSNKGQQTNIKNNVSINVNSNIGWNNLQNKLNKIGKITNDLHKKKINKKVVYKYTEVDTRLINTIKFIQNPNNLLTSKKNNIAVSSSNDDEINDKIKNIIKQNDITRDLYFLKQKQIYYKYLQHEITIEQEKILNAQINYNLKMSGFLYSVGMPVLVSLTTTGAVFAVNCVFIANISSISSFWVPLCEVMMNSKYNKFFFETIIGIMSFFGLFDSSEVVTLKDLFKKMTQEMNTDTYKFENIKSKDLIENIFKKGSNVKINENTKNTQGFFKYIKGCLDSRDIIGNYSAGESFANLVLKNYSIYIKTALGICKMFVETYSFINVSTQKLQLLPKSGEIIILKDLVTNMLSTSTANEVFYYITSCMGEIPSQIVNKFNTENVNMILSPFKPITDVVKPLLGKTVSNILDKFTSFASSYLNLTIEQMKTEILRLQQENNVLNDDSDYKIRQQIKRDVDEGDKLIKLFKNDFDIDIIEEKKIAFTKCINTDDKNKCYLELFKYMKSVLLDENKDTQSEDDLKKRLEIETQLDTIIRILESNPQEEGTDIQVKIDELMKKTNLLFNFVSNTIKLGKIDENAEKIAVNITKINNLKKDLLKKEVMEIKKIINDLKYNSNIDVKQSEKSITPENLKELLIDGFESINLLSSIKDLDNCNSITDLENIKTCYSTNIKNIVSMFKSNDSKFIKKIQQYDVSLSEINSIDEVKKNGLKINTEIKTYFYNLLVEILGLQVIEKNTEFKHIDMSDDEIVSENEEKEKSRMKKEKRKELQARLKEAQMMISEQVFGKVKSEIARLDIILDGNKEKLIKIVPNLFTEIVRKFTRLFGKKIDEIRTIIYEEINHGANNIAFLVTKLPIEKQKSDLMRLLNNKIINQEKYDELFVILDDIDLFSQIKMEETEQETEKELATDKRTIYRIEESMKYYISQIDEIISQEEEKFKLKPEVKPILEGETEIYGQTQIKILNQELPPSLVKDAKTEEEYNLIEELKESIKILGDKMSILSSSIAFEDLNNNFYKIIVEIIQKGQDERKTEAEILDEIQSKVEEYKSINLGEIYTAIEKESNPKLIKNSIEEVKKYVDDFSKKMSDLLMYKVTLKEQQEALKNFIKSISNLESKPEKTSIETDVINEIKEKIKATKNSIEDTEKIILTNEKYIKSLQKIKKPEEKSYYSSEESKIEIESNMILSIVSNKDESFLGAAGLNMVNQFIQISVSDFIQTNKNKLVNVFFSNFIDDEELKKYKEQILKKKKEKIVTIEEEILQYSKIYKNNLGNEAKIKAEIVTRNNILNPGIISPFQFKTPYMKLVQSIYSIFYSHLNNPSMIMYAAYSAIISQNVLTTGFILKFFGGVAGAIFTQQQTLSNAYTKKFELNKIMNDYSFLDKLPSKAFAVELLSNIFTGEITLPLILNYIIRFFLGSDLVINNTLSKWKNKLIKETIHDFNLIFLELSNIIFYSNSVQSVYRYIENILGVWLTGSFKTVVTFFYKLTVLPGIEMKIQTFLPSGNINILKIIGDPKQFTTLCQFINYKMYNIFKNLKQGNFGSMISEFTDFFNKKTDYLADITTFLDVNDFLQKYNIDPNSSLDKLNGNIIQIRNRDSTELEDYIIVGNDGDNFKLIPYNKIKKYILSKTEEIDDELKEKGLETSDEIFFEDKVMNDLFIHYTDEFFENNPKLSKTDDFKKYEKTILPLFKDFLLKKAAKMFNNGDIEKIQIIEYGLINKLINSIDNQQVELLKNEEELLKIKEQRYIIKKEFDNITTLLDESIKNNSPENMKKNAELMEKQKEKEQIYNDVNKDFDDKNKHIKTFYIFSSVKSNYDNWKNSGEINLNKTIFYDIFSNISEELKLEQIKAKKDLEMGKPSVLTEFADIVTTLSIKEMYESSIVKDVIIFLPYYDLWENSINYIKKKVNFRDYIKISELLLFSVNETDSVLNIRQKLEKLEVLEAKSSNGELTNELQKLNTLFGTRFDSIKNLRLDYEFQFTKTLELNYISFNELGLDEKDIDGNNFYGLFVQQILKRYDNEEDILDEIKLLELISNPNEEIKVQIKDLTQILDIKKNIIQKEEEIKRKIINNESGTKELSALKEQLVDLNINIISNKLFPQSDDNKEEDTLMKKYICFIVNKIKEINDECVLENKMLIRELLKPENLLTLLNPEHKKISEFRSTAESNRLFRLYKTISTGVKSFFSCKKQYEELTKKISSIQIELRDFLGRTLEEELGPDLDTCEKTMNQLKDPKIVKYGFNGKKYNSEDIMKMSVEKFITKRFDGENYYYNNSENFDEAIDKCPTFKKLFEKFKEKITELETEMGKLETVINGLKDLKNIGLTNNDVNDIKIKEIIEKMIKKFDTVRFTLNNYNFEKENPIIGELYKYMSFFEVVSSLLPKKYGTVDDIFYGTKYKKSNSPHYTSYKWLDTKYPNKDTMASLNQVFSQLLDIIGNDEKMSGESLVSKYLKQLKTNADEAKKTEMELELKYKDTGEILKKKLRDLRIFRANELQNSLVNNDNQDILFDIFYSISDLKIQSIQDNDTKLVLDQFRNLLISILTNSNANENSYALLYDYLSGTLPLSLTIELVQNFDYIVESYNNFDSVIQEKCDEIIRLNKENALDNFSAEVFNTVKEYLNDERTYKFDKNIKVYDKSQMDRVRNFSYSQFENIEGDISVIGDRVYSKILRIEEEIQSYINFINEAIESKKYVKFNALSSNINGPCEIVKLIIDKKQELFKLQRQILEKYKKKLFSEQIKNVDDYYKRFIIGAEQVLTYFDDDVQKVYNKFIRNGIKEEEKFRPTTHIIRDSETSSQQLAPQEVPQGSQLVQPLPVQQVSPLQSSSTIQETNPIKTRNQQRKDDLKKAEEKSVEKQKQEKALKQQEELEQQQQQSYKEELKKQLLLQGGMDDSVADAVSGILGSLSKLLTSEVDSEIGSDISIHITPETPVKEIDELTSESTFEMCKNISGKWWWSGDKIQMLPGYDDQLALAMSCSDDNYISKRIAIYANKAIEYFFANIMNTMKYIKNTICISGGVMFGDTITKSIIAGVCQIIDTILKLEKCSIELINLHIINVLSEYSTNSKKKNNSKFNNIATRFGALFVIHSLSYNKLKNEMKNTPVVSKIKISDILDPCNILKDPENTEDALKAKSLEILEEYAKNIETSDPKDYSNLLQKDYFGHIDKGALPINIKDIDELLDLNDFSNFQKNGISEDKKKIVKDMHDKSKKNKQIECSTYINLNYSEVMYAVITDSFNFKYLFEKISCVVTKNPNFNIIKISIAIIIEVFSFICIVDVSKFVGLDICNTISTYIKNFFTGYEENLLKNIFNAFAELIGEVFENKFMRYFILNKMFGSQSNENSINVGRDIMDDYFKKMDTLSKKTGEKFSKIVERDIKIGFEQLCSDVIKKIFFLKQESVKIANPNELQIYSQIKGDIFSNLLEKNEDPSDPSFLQFFEILSNDILNQIVEPVNEALRATIFISNIGDSDETSKSVANNKSESDFKIILELKNELESIIKAVKSYSTLGEPEKTEIYNKFFPKLSDLDDSSNSPPFFKRILENLQVLRDNIKFLSWSFIDSEKKTEYIELIGQAEIIISRINPVRKMRQRFIKKIQEKVEKSNENVFVNGQIRNKIILENSNNFIINYCEDDELLIIIDNDDNDNNNDNINNNFLCTKNISDEEKNNIERTKKDYDDIYIDELLLFYLNDKNTIDIPDLVFLLFGLPTLPNENFDKNMFDYIKNNYNKILVRLQILKTNGLEEEKYNKFIAMFKAYNLSNNFEKTYYSFKKKPEKKELELEFNYLIEKENKNDADIARINQIEKDLKQLTIDEDTSSFFEYIKNKKEEIISENLSTKNNFKAELLTKFDSDDPKNRNLLIYLISNSLMNKYTNDPKKLYFIFQNILELIESSETESEASAESGTESAYKKQTVELEKLRDEFIPDDFTPIEFNFMISNIYDFKKIFSNFFIKTQKNNFKLLAVPLFQSKDLSKPIPNKFMIFKDGKNIEIEKGKEKYFIAELYHEFYGKKFVFPTLNTMEDIIQYFSEDPTVKITELNDVYNKLDYIYSFFSNSQSKGYMVESHKKYDNSIIDIVSSFNPNSWVSPVKQTFLKNEIDKIKKIIIRSIMDFKNTINDNKKNYEERFLTRQFDSFKLDLQYEVIKMEFEIDDKVTEINNKNKEISNKGSEISVKDKEISDKSTEIGVKDKEISDKSTEIFTANQAKQQAEDNFINFLDDIYKKFIDECSSKEKIDIKKEELEKNAGWFSNPFKNYGLLAEEDIKQECIKQERKKLNLILNSSDPPTGTDEKKYGNAYKQFVIEFQILYNAFMTYTGQNTINFNQGQLPNIELKNIFSLYQYNENKNKKFSFPVFVEGTKTTIYPSNLDKRNDDLEKQKFDLESKKSDLEKEKVELEKQKNELEKENTELEKENTELEKENGDLNKYKREIETTIGDLNKFYDYNKKQTYLTNNIALSQNIILSDSKALLFMRQKYDKYYRFNKNYKEFGKKSVLDDKFITSIEIMIQILLDDTQNNICSGECENLRIELKNILEENELQELKYMVKLLNSEYNSSPKNNLEKYIKTQDNLKNAIKKFMNNNDNKLKIKTIFDKFTNLPNLSTINEKALENHNIEKGLFNDYDKYLQEQIKEVDTIKKEIERGYPGIVKGIIQNLKKGFQEVENIVSYDDHWWFNSAVASKEIIFPTIIDSGYSPDYNEDLLYKTSDTKSFDLRKFVDYLKYTKYDREKYPDDFEKKKNIYFEFIIKYYTFFPYDKKDVSKGGIFIFNADLELYKITIPNFNEETFLTYVKKTLIEKKHTEQAKSFFEMDNEIYRFYKDIIPFSIFHDKSNLIYLNVNRQPGEPVIKKYISGSLLNNLQFKQHSKIKSTVDELGYIAKSDDKLPYNLPKSVFILSLISQYLAGFNISGNKDFTIITNFINELKLQGYPNNQFIDLKKISQSRLIRVKEILKSFDIIPEVDDTGQEQYVLIYKNNYDTTNDINFKRIMMYNAKNSNDEYIIPSQINPTKWKINPQWKQTQSFISSNNPPYYYKDTDKFDNILEKNNYELPFLNTGALPELNDLKYIEENVFFQMKQNKLINSKIQELFGDLTNLGTITDFDFDIKINNFEKEVCDKQPNQSIKQICIDKKSEIVNKRNLEKEAQNKINEIAEKIEADRLEVVEQSERDAKDSDSRLKAENEEARKEEFKLKVIEDTTLKTEEKKSEDEDMFKQKRIAFCEKYKNEFSPETNCESVQEMEDLIYNIFKNYADNTIGDFFSNPKEALRYYNMSKEVKELYSKEYYENRIFYKNGALNMVDYFIDKYERKFKKQHPELGGGKMLEKTIRKNKNKNKTQTRKNKK